MEAHPTSSRSESVETNRSSLAVQREQITDVGPMTWPQIARREVGEQAEKNRASSITGELFVGTALTVPFPAGSFDERARGSNLFDRALCVESPLMGPVSSERAASRARVS